MHACGCVPGVGVSLYFYFVRSLALFFAVAALLHVPHIILCYYGGMLAAYKIGTTQMGSFTAANHLIKYPVGPAGSWKYRWARSDRLCWWWSVSRQPTSRT